MSAKKNARHAETLASEQHDGRTEYPHSLDAGVIGTPNTTSGHPYTDARVESARKTYHMACDWRSRNPRAYATIESLALALAERGHKFGSKLLAEKVRMKDVIEDETGEYFRISNSFTSVFTRWLRSDHPEIAHLIRIKPCALDVVMADE